MHVFAPYGYSLCQRKSVLVHCRCDMVFGVLFILIAFLLEASGCQFLYNVPWEIVFNNISPRRWKMLIIFLNEQEVSKWRRHNVSSSVWPVQNTNNRLTSVTEIPYFHWLPLRLNVAFVCLCVFFSICLKAGWGAWWPRCAAVRCVQVSRQPPVSGLPVLHLLC